MRTSYLVSLVAMIYLATGCTQSDLTGEKDANKDSENSNNDNITIEENTPEDSTGAFVSIGLDMQTSTGASLWLEGDSAAEKVADEDSEEKEAEDDAALDTTSDPDVTAASEPLKLSDTLTLTMARFNIASIKVKAKKEASEIEHKLEKKERAEDDKKVAELESDDSNENNNEKADKSELTESNKDQSDDMMVENEHDKIKDKIKAKRDDFKNEQESHKERDQVRDKSTKFHGPYVFDAIAGKIEGDAPSVDLNDGSYRRIEFKMKRNVTAADADPLLGNVFVIKGTVAKGEESVPFAITWHSSMNFRLKGDKALKVEPENDAKLSIVFDLDKWFDGIDMTSAEVSADGVIYINKKSNHQLMKQLRKNIKMNTRCGKDKDGNGKIDENETEGQGEDTPDTVE